MVLWERTFQQIAALRIEIFYRMLEFNSIVKFLVQSWKMKSLGLQKQFISQIQQVRHLVEMMTELIYKERNNYKKKWKNEK